MPQKNHRDHSKNSFSLSVIRIVKGIPRWKVATYGQIVALAGNPMAARQVVRILHSCSSQSQSLIRLLPEMKRKIKSLS